MQNNWISLCLLTLHALLFLQLNDMQTEEDTPWRRPSIPWDHPNSSSHLNVTYSVIDPWSNFWRTPFVRFPINSSLFTIEPLRNRRALFCSCVLECTLCSILHWFGFALAWFCTVLSFALCWVFHWFGFALCWLLHRFGFTQCWVLHWFVFLLVWFCTGLGLHRFGFALCWVLHWFGFALV